MYLLKGRLPWQGLRAETAIEKFSMIAERKCSTSPVELCSGLPNEFASYVGMYRTPCSVVLHHFYSFIYSIRKSQPFLFGNMKIEMINNEF